MKDGYTHTHVDSHRLVDSHVIAKSMRSRDVLVEYHRPEVGHL